MRIILKFSKNESLVPINNQSYVNYYIHKCLGENNEFHNSKNDYSISHLYGGKLTEDKKHLSFENGGMIVVSSKNTLFLDKIIDGIINNPYLNWGMKYKEIININESFCTGWNHFATLSPFIIKKYSDKKTYSFATINESDFVDIVKNHTIKKLNAMFPGIDLSNFMIRINNNPSHKTKLIKVKNVKNIANQCHVSIFCDKKVAEEIYNMGLGQSTGSGFGTIYKTENRDMYKIR